MAREDVYDLGEIDRDRRQPVFGAAMATPDTAPSRFRHTASHRASAGGVGGALAGTLSMFVPGLGQLIAGEITWGLFYLTGIGFCAAALWALFGMLERIVPTLSVLDVPSVVLTVAFLSLAALTMLLHVAAVLHAYAVAPGEDRSAPHPIVAGIASITIPGWGQLLCGHRRRAALFLSSIWVLGTAWLLVTPAGTRVLDRLGLELPNAVRDGWGPAAMLATPFVLWVIAIYDAAAGAAAERRRWR